MAAIASPTSIAQAPLLRSMVLEYLSPADIEDSLSQGSLDALRITATSADDVGGTIVQGITASPTTHLFLSHFHKHFGNYYHLAEMERGTAVPIWGKNEPPPVFMVSTLVDGATRELLIARGEVVARFCIQNRAFFLGAIQAGALIGHEGNLITNEGRIAPEVAASMQRWARPPVMRALALILSRAGIVAP